MTVTCATVNDPRAALRERCASLRYARGVAQHATAGAAQPRDLIIDFEFPNPIPMFYAMNVKLLDLQAQYLPIRNEIRRAIDEVCDQQALILGPVVERFEKNLASYCQTKHAIGVSSGTDALLCSLMALGIKSGDEVICPAFTFFATAGCIARVGARPVFCDVEYGSFNMDPADLRRKVSKKTKAIMPVHLFGQMAKMEEINAIAAECGGVVIEDAAQA